MYVHIQALAQDQLNSVNTICSKIRDIDERHVINAFTLDGDTDYATRDMCRNNANIILTNPDMLHCSILPDVSALKLLLLL
jgi:DEAD/DEAH box helicase domain-containing protein